MVIKKKEQVAKGNKTTILFFYTHQDQEVCMASCWSEYKRSTKNKQAEKGHSWEAAAVILAEEKGERRVPLGSHSQQETYQGCVWNWVIVGEFMEIKWQMNNNEFPGPDVIYVKDLGELKDEISELLSFM